MKLRKWPHHFIYYKDSSHQPLRKRVTLPSSLFLFIIRTLKGYEIGGAVFFLMEFPGALDFVERFFEGTFSLEKLLPKCYHMESCAPGCGLLRAGENDPALPKPRSPCSASAPTPPPPPASRATAGWALQCDVTWGHLEATFSCIPSLPSTSRSKLKIL